MSYAQNGVNGKSNRYGHGYGGGYGGPDYGAGGGGGGGGAGGDQANRYGNYGNGALPRGQRAGGYGGFGGDSAQDRPRTPNYAPANAVVPQPQASPSASFRTERRRGGSNAGGLFAPDARDDRRRTYFGTGAGAKSLEDVVQHIMDKWTIMATDDCVPVHVALQLMDNSSLGRGSDYDDFLRTGSSLQKSLRAIVNEHHQGFNSSIGTFHKIQSSIQQSQQKVRVLKTSLEDAKSNLTTAKPELAGLATTSRTYDDMLDILSQIEKLQAVPEHLDAKISDKHFLSAVDVLQDGLRLIRNDKLENIGALSDLRSYLDTQEASLTDILIEELHDHLYLKSPYCQDRWKPYFQDAGGLPNGDTSLLGRTGGIRPVIRFLTSLDTKTIPIDDTSRNVETDSFQYIHIIIEALNKLGRLEAAVDRIEQRLPIELFAVVEKTNQEVDTRHPAHTRMTRPADRSRSYFDIGNTHANDEILNDLLYTLYSKFEAIAEGHRAVHEVINGIISRERLRKADTLLSGFKELWKLYQSEIRSLLHDYLASTSSAYSASRERSSMNTSVFRQVPRDKTKPIFKLGELNKQSSQVATEQEDLDKILHASVPGLVSKSYRRSTIRAGDKTNVTETHAVTHRMLVEPSVFNISLLLPPSLLFLNRLKDILPSNSDIAPSTLTSFLDKFLIDVFNSQLEETVNDLCAQVFSDAASYQQDIHWTEHSRKPIFRGTVSFFYLIKEFCRMLDHVPQDESFAELMLGQLQTYYKNCFNWYTGLVSRAHDDGQGRLFKPAAAAVESGELSELLRNLLDSDSSDRRSEAIQTEVTALIQQGAENPTDTFNIVSDPRTVSSLCLLYNSLQWLASHLEKLRRVVKDDLFPQPSGISVPGGRRSHRWSLLGLGIRGENDQPIYLQMSAEGVGQFDKIASSYRALAKKALFTLHVDVRYGIMRTLAKVLAAHYFLDQQSNEPDPSIKGLNADLLTSDETLGALLPDTEYGFMTAGLGLLIDSYLVANAGRIRLMNAYGCERMLLNILVLQQNLKSVEHDVALTRSRSFFGYFSEGVEALVRKAQETGGEGMGVNLEEVKVLVELIYSEAMQSENRDVKEKAKRSMDDYMFQLTEAMWAL